MQRTRHPIAPPAALELLVSCLLLILSGCAEPDSFGPELPDSAQPAPIPPEAAVAPTNFWANKASMPTARSHLAVGAVSGLLYAVGGELEGSVPVARVEAYNPSTNSWSTRAALPAARVALNGTGTINGKLYVAGGFGISGGTQAATKTLYVYDPSTNTWATRAPMLFTAGCGASAVIGGRLYVYSYATTCGSGGSSFQRYDPGTNTWTQLANPVGQHAYPAAGVVGGKFYLAAGLDNFGQATGRLEVYDPATDSWTTKASMARLRTAAAGVVINGLFYVVGGWVPDGGVGAYLNEVEVYDPGTDTWYDVPGMSAPRGFLGAAVVSNKIYAVGGRTYAGVLATNQVYTPGDVWVTKQPLTTARAGAVAGVIGSQLYVVGGISTNTLAPLTTNESYTPSTDTWASRAPLPQAVTEADGAAVINGVLYVPGGLRGSTYQNTLYAYTASSNTWATKTSVPVAGADGVSGAIGGKLYVLTGAAAGVGYVKRLDRYDPGTNTWTSRAAPLGYHLSAAGGVINGKLYIAGGATPSGVSNAVEVYDPGTNSWNPLAPMPTARSAAAGVVVNGLLYVVGGKTASLNTMATVEVYSPDTDSWRTLRPVLTARSYLAGGALKGQLYAVSGVGGGAVNQAYTP
jgi:N-acetylneuraminic acid mutarotase